MSYYRMSEYVFISNSSEGTPILIPLIYTLHYTYTYTLHYTYTYTLHYTYTYTYIITYISL